MMIQIFYGFGQKLLNVTTRAFENCFDGDRIYIPSGDTGAMFFPDPLYGKSKTVIVFRHEDEVATCRQYLPGEEIRIILSEQEKSQIDPRPRRDITGEHESPIIPPPVDLTTDDKIRFFHSQLQCLGGDITHEWREQSMVVNFLRPDAKVLELGSNIGRNTLMIACVLEDERNLVTLECNPFFVELLRNNRFANHLDFHIEPSALSYRKLMQSKNCRQFGAEAEAWESIPSDELPEGYEWIDTITFSELEKKYQLVFDTLVSDCEGALYYILQDDPSILRGIETVILESDYRQAEHKWSVEALFTSVGLEKVHAEALVPNLTNLPQACADSFWEVWKRRS